MLALVQEAEHEGGGPTSTPAKKSPGAAEFTSRIDGSLRLTP
jgi:hypothetical protein